MMKLLTEVADISEAATDPPLSSIADSKTHVMTEETNSLFNSKYLDPLIYRG